MSRWIAWVPLGNDPTLDNRLANPKAYCSLAHLVPYEYGPQPDGNYATEWGKGSRVDQHQIVRSAGLGQKIFEVPDAHPDPLARLRLLERGVEVLPP